MSQMDGKEFRRLERIEVDRLFGTYDHRIDLNLDAHVTLLHGPNGVGKTVVLRMIDALLNARLSYFRRIPFARFSIRFHDGSEIVLRKSSEDDEPSTITLHENGNERSAQVHLRTEAERIAASVGYLQRHPATPDAWIDTRDGEPLIPSEILSRYRHHPSDREGDEQEHPWLADFLYTANDHLIEAQRLFQFGGTYRAIPRRRNLRLTQDSLVSTVVEYSQDFRERLAQTMADYGRQAQTLDQSFPQRLIVAQEELSAAMLERKMSDLENKNTELIKIGILEETQAHPIPVGRLESIDSTQRRVMTLYVRDTTAKLAELDYLKDRSSLLLEKMNQKYQHKSIRVDREDGLVAVGNDDRRLALDCLSSGEQNEFVLYYDLLFRVPSNTIVLIDEPELSLHVAWQKKFIPDLLEIIEVTGFDALIATHSPYIVGERDDLMIGLGGSV